MGTKQYDSATDLITFSRASSATFLGSNGLLQTAANNVPRIEYDATGAVKGLLIEEQRTNVCTYSNDFLTTWAAAYITITPNSAISPDGTMNATKFDMASNGYTRKLSGHVPTVGQTYTFSVWIKAGTASEVKTVMLFTGGGLGYTSVTQTLTNEWQRFTITSTLASGTPDQVRARIMATQAGTIFVYGAQIEEGAFPTSYIPTEGASATRARDLAEIPTSAFGYNNDKGSVAVEFKSNKPSSDFYGAFVLSDGSPTNRIIHHTFNGGHRGTVVSSGVSEVNVVAGSRGAPSELVKFAVGFSDNNFAASLNGATAVTDTSVTIPSGLSKLALGYYYPTNPQSNMLNGHIKSIQYYPRRLTDTQLQELTT
jgi:hypothetical protein